VNLPVPSRSSSMAHMRSAWFLSAVLLLASSVPAVASDPAQEEVTRDFEKTVMLSGKQGLSLDHRMGQVHIRGNSGHELKISAKIHVAGPFERGSTGLRAKNRD